jgi:N-dimethylarginine dimethylaminohydrolase
MKYRSRQRETAPLTEAFRALGLATVAFPFSEVFEGEGEALWFHDGHLLVVGYGFRASARSVTLLRRVIGHIYRSYGIVPPRIVGIPLETPRFYHLDMAMLAVHATRAIVHESAFSNASLRRLREVISVSVINVSDSFCLNGICTRTTLYVHQLDPALRKLLKALTGLEIVENDVSEFEKAGGSVRCMILNTN